MEKKRLSVVKSKRKCVPLSDDVRSLVALYSDLDELQILSEFWLPKDGQNLPRRCLKIHDPCFNDLLSLGYQPDYASEVQTRLFEQPIQGTKRLNNSEIKLNDFAISVHLNVNEDLVVHKTRIVDYTVISMDLNGTRFQCKTYDISCTLWINHLPSGRKCRISMQKFTVFQTGLEILCSTADEKITCELNLLNHNLRMNDFLFHSLDVVFMDKRGEVFRNITEIFTTLDFI